VPRGGALRGAPVPFRLVTVTEPTSREPPDPPSSVRAVPYKGADLDGERGPGLGCFRFQLVVLALLIVLTPIGVAANWPAWLTAALLFATIALLLVAGQTIIFLLRLVAADRRGRRRPMASATRTVGELEDELEDEGEDELEDELEHVPADAAAPVPGDDVADESSVRQ
jgi:hypothetical protein